MDNKSLPKKDSGLTVHIDFELHKVDIDENKKVTINISPEESQQELAGANF